MISTLDLDTVRAGEIILFPGEATKLYRVRRGLVRLHAVDDDGGGITLRYVKQGGYFGEEALSGAERLYFAEAVTACTLESIEPESLSIQDLRTLTAHLTKAMGKLYMSLYRLSGKHLKARIAAELLELGDSELASVNEQRQVTIRTTHDDLAAAVGSVRETVTKVVGELSRENLISAGYGKISLLDTEKLKSLANN